MKIEAKSEWKSHKVAASVWANNQSSYEEDYGGKRKKKGSLAVMSIFGRSQKIRNWIQPRKTEVSLININFNFIIII